MSFYEGGHLMKNYTCLILGKSKKRYFNLLKKCFLLNVLAFSLGAFSVPAVSGTATNAATLKSDLASSSTTTIVASGTNISVTYAESEENASTGLIALKSVNLTGTGFIGGRLRNAGTISFLGAGHLSFSNNKITASFPSNSDDRSHAAAIYNSGTIFFAGDTTFKSNSVIDGGIIPWAGAIDNEGKITFGGTATFSNNSAAGDGGAIYNGIATNPTLIFNKAATFTSNSAGGDGGAIWADESTNTFNNTASFTNNSASDGGAIDAYDSSFIFKNTATFTGNTASRLGGAIGNTNGSLEFQKTATFSNNKTTATSTSAVGGAIYTGYLGTSTLTFKDMATFSGNSASTSAESKSASGGAIYNYLSSTATATTVTFEKGASFSGNSVKATGTDGNAYGGAIYNDSDGASVTFSGVTEFKNNTATSSSGVAQGGAIYNKDSITFSGVTTFEGNIATGATNTRGGAIRTNNKGTVTFNDNVTFKKNQAKSTSTSLALGGALYNYGTTTFNKNFLFTENKVTSSDSASAKGADIYNGEKSSIIFAAGEGTIGTLDGGIHQLGGTINKTGAGTLILGDNAVNSWETYTSDENETFTPSFTQTAGLTIANTSNFNLGETQTISGEGTHLKLHGDSLSNLTASVSDGAQLTYLTTNSSVLDIALPSTVSLTDVVLTLGAYTSAEKQAELDLISDNTFFSGYDASANLLTASTIDRASYNLTADITGASEVIFKDADVTVATGTYATNYTFDNSRLDTTGSSSLIFNGAMNFKNSALSGDSSLHGGAIYSVSDSSIIFNGETSFANNSVMGSNVLGGAIYNTTSLDLSSLIKFTEAVSFQRNLIEGDASTVAGGAIYNERGVIEFGSTAEFLSNSVTGTGSVVAVEGGTIYNKNGTIEFVDDAIFTNNSATGSNVLGGVISNSREALYGESTLTFNKAAIFTGNTATGDFASGGVIYNYYDGTITFKGATSFANNSLTATGEYSTGGGAIYNSGSIEFDGTTTFTNNSINATATGASSYIWGGAIFNSLGDISFEEEATFTNNKILATNSAQGGAIYNCSSITFNDGFLFSGNTVSATNTTNAKGADIYNDGTIIFAGGTGTVGSLDGGIYQSSATINKTGAGTLILGDGMVNNYGRISSFTQSAGLTIANTSNFKLGETQTITGGELRVHGGTLSDLTATVSNGAQLTYLTTNSSSQEASLPTSLTVKGAEVVFGAYTDSAKAEEVALASTKVVPELDSDGNVVYNTDGSIKYTAYDVTGKLLTSNTIDKAHYKLSSDIASTSKAAVVTFKDADVSFGSGTLTYAGNYALSDTSSMNLINGTKDHLTFNNLQATNIDLSMDFGDIIDTTVAQIVFDLTALDTSLITSIENVETYQALKGGATFANTKSFELDGILDGLIANVIAGEQYITITGTPVSVVEYTNLGKMVRSNYSALFNMATAGDLNDGIYTYQITSVDQNPSNPVASSMGPVGTNKKQIIGATSNASESIIQANGYKVLEYTSSNAGEATLKNVTIDGASSVITVASDTTATVNLDNVVVQGATSSAVRNEGTLTLNASNGALFKDNEVTSGEYNAYKGGAIYNNGTLTVDGVTSFTGNLVNGVGGYDQGGGAVYNDYTSNIAFKGNTSFINNSVISKNVEARGGAIYASQQTDTDFVGEVVFEKNTVSTGSSSASGGAIFNDGGMKFNNIAIFTENSATASSVLGGAIYNGPSATISFNDKVIFTSNKAIGSYANGGAIYNDSSITFNDGFLFSGNTVSATDSANAKGADIYNAGTITFAGGTGTVGTLDGGIYQQDGKINKTGAGTLILGDGMVNGYVGSATFTQSAGLTIADTRKMNFAKTNTITGGTLETHGNASNLKVSFAGTDSSNKVVWKHYSTGGTSNLDNVSLNANSEAVFGTYTDDIKQGYIDAYVEDGATNTLFTTASVANGTKTTYALNKDIAQNGGKVTFKDANIKLGASSYVGAYVVDNSNTIDMQNNQQDETTFTNLTGSEANLLIDMIFNQEEDGSISLTTDKLTTKTDYAFGSVEFNVSGQELLNAFINNLILDQTGEFDPAIKYETAVLGGKATFKETSSALLSNTSPYVYEMKTEDQTVSIEANKIKDTPLEYLAKYEGNATLQMDASAQGGANYEVSSDETIDTLSGGDKKILGASTVATESTIQANGKDLFKLDNQNTSLEVKNITIDGANTVVDNQKGDVLLENVIIQDSTAGTVVKNASQMALTQVTVDQNIENTGSLEAINVKANALNNKGVLTARGLDLAKLTNSGDTAIVTLSGVNTLEQVENNSTVTMSDGQLSLTNLTGVGTLNMNNATLDVAGKFSTSNDLIANNLTIGSNAQDLSFAKVVVQEGGFLDIGKSTLHGDTVSFNDNSKLITHINALSGTEYGKVSGNTIHVSDKGTELAIVVATGEHFTTGYKNFTLLDAETLNAPAESGFARVLENSMYDIYYIGNGEYQLCTKGSDCPGSGKAPVEPTPPPAPSKKPGVCKGIHCIHDEFVLGEPIEEEGKPKEIQDTLNDMAQILGPNSKEYIAALEGLAPDTSALIQSHSFEIINRLSTIVSKQLSTASEQTGYTHRGYRFYKFPKKESRMWVQTIYGTSEISGAKGFDMDTTGLAFGFDTPIADNSKIGLAYAHMKADGSAVQRDTDITSHVIMAYGEYNPSRVYVNWQALYGRSSYEENKKVFQHRIKADYDVDMLSAQVMVGKKMGPFVSKNWATGVISPEMGLRYTYLKQHEYEDEAGQRVASSDTQILTGVLGVSYSIGYRLSPVISWYPELRIASTYDLIEPEFENKITLPNGALYQVDGESMDRFGIEIGARVGFDVNRKAEIAFEYEGNFKGDYTNHTGKASAKYKF